MFLKRRGHKRNCYSAVKHLHTYTHTSLVMKHLWCYTPMGMCCQLDFTTSYMANLIQTENNKVFGKEIKLPCVQHGEYLFIIWRMVLNLFDLIMILNYGIYCITALYLFSFFLRNILFFPEIFNCLPQFRELWMSW